ncbi:hypothetical protein [Cryobacterium sp. PAMC25264]|uniref:hypothetical protein n=1 Tax=Cryobacterium sp. PAMC25264 TaxID=2861288 RepID=UPI002107BBCE|nr:hypothetical protein [Cryobacterium sp. PAMC25264]
MSARFDVNRVDWRSWGSWRRSMRRFRRGWRRSLQWRTVAITVAAASAAIALVGVYMSVSVGNDLFQSRLNQVLVDSNRATAAAQGILDSSDAVDRVQVQTLLESARTSISAASSSRLVALFRVPGQESSTVAPQDSSTFGTSTAVIAPNCVRPCSRTATGSSGNP